jgi:formylglycine-generating enzyme required for sulfatase activity
VFNGDSIAVVGSKSPAGDGKWGHADLAGNVYDWVLDYFDAYPMPCVDCANHAVAALRGDRGGSYAHAEGNARSTARGQLQPTSGSGSVGFRCARTP